MKGFFLCFVFASFNTILVAQVGYISTMYGKLFRSNDNGLSWQEPNSGSYVGSPAGDNRIFFINSELGFVYGAPGYDIRRTTDGGLSWQGVNISESHVTGLSFLNSNNGFCISPGNNTSIFYKSMDGGLNWTIVSFINNISPSCLSFVSSNVGYIGEGNGSVKKTTDGGITWTTVGYVGPAIMDIKFINESTGFLCCVNASVYKTTNGGLDWEYLSNYSGGSCAGMSILNNKIYVVSSVGLSTSINSGLNWNSIDLNNLFNISSASGISFVSSTASIETFSNNETSIFPNPASDNIIVRKNHLNESSSFKIFNSLGSIVQSGILYTGENKIPLNLSPGIYQIKIDDEILRMIIQ